ncbi:telomeric repeat-binding factor 2-interacting protein 1 [Melopsittacus undulatus]|uniref:telomeric repeat-binding factor 2-interacting protein 1 n=1 Tax=Melopsittacus undulatus TaxID=13146 RepID=UPI00146AAE43|nr:telomeric repeat-binding factor 2-interacting protein 1 [Melopsittacus undulatus]
MAERSRSLFRWDNDSPMRFYVRPGPDKLRLAPLVLAGGGRLCRVREPGAVLLAPPGEAAPGGAVSTEYVTECVRRNERLPMEPFRLPAASSTPVSAMASPRGRLAFSAEEDAALARTDASEISRELPTKERISPGETGSGLNTALQDSAGPDSRLQMEEQPTSTSSSSMVGDAVKTMRYVMEKSGMDLLTVTQAFLKNSGDAEATLHFLQTGRRRDGYPVWSREDDLELQNYDESVRNKLIAKFGTENVEKRIAFRKS